MERNYQFKIGQRVKMFDTEDNEWAFGTVTDYSSDKVFIKWDDISDPCGHERHEFEEIKLA